ncbi:bacteriocin immunity protein [Schleiferilactobacillus harbinensis]|uniref:bacteriocin immunity protein n=1 Tax=Schleiferilactobacillus harbinensis TaxID=304207 RepID=UPI0009E53708|nr:bacteriocin immunity protein [Schleiferilactobacillus harbinensis]
MSKKSQLWAAMDQLIADQGLSAAEHQVLLMAHNELSSGKYDEAVVAQLKSQLSQISFKTRLSPKIVPFFTELSRLYLGYGRRDNISLP